MAARLFERLPGVGRVLGRQIAEATEIVGRWLPHVPPKSAWLFPGGKAHLAIATAHHFTFSNGGGNSPAVDPAHLTIIQQATIDYMKDPAATNKIVIDAVAQGRTALGICNGFQVLTEAGLLPGALVRNAGLHFICDRTSLKVERGNTPWTSAYTSGEIIDLPIAHGEGNYYADADTLAELEEHDQVLFRYCTEAGEINAAGNPNGSLNNIAGICNRAGNVLGMMPHPERASDPMLGETDGMKLFQGLLMATIAAIL